MTAMLLDEMLSGVIAAQLRARNVNAVAVVEDPQLIGMPDEELLALAATQDRLLVTANVADFAALAIEWGAADRQHAGLVYVTNRVFPQERSLIGALVSSLLAFDLGNDAPARGTETLLRRKPTTSAEP